MASVIVVGGGLAGLTATITAVQKGARSVYLVEKEKSVAGNSAKATSGINACGTETQAHANVKDSIHAFFRDTIASGQSYSDHTLARMLTTQSRSALEFLSEVGNVTLDGVTQCGGHGLARTHFERPLTDGKPRPVGWDIVFALRAAVERMENVTVLKSCRVVELLQQTDGNTTDTPRGACPVIGVTLLCATPAAAEAAAAAGAVPPHTRAATVQNDASTVKEADGVVGAINTTTPTKEKTAAGVTPDGVGAGAASTSTAANGAAAAPSSAAPAPVAPDHAPSSPAAPLLFELMADAVVLTTGGFGADHTSTSLLMEFAPGIATLPTTNGSFTTGDGVKLCRLAGAHLRGMEFVQLHPTGFVDPADPDCKTKFLAPEALRGFGAIMLNSRGVRFVDELARRDAVSNEMFRWCCAPGPEAACAELPRSLVPRPVQAFLVMTKAAVAKFGPNFDFYVKKGFFKQVEGAAGLAAAIGHGTNVDTTTATLRSYAACAISGVDQATGKRTFPDKFTSAETDTLFVAIVTPSIHYTMGGVATSASAELLYADMSEVVRGNMLIPEMMRTAPEPEAADFAQPAAAARAAAEQPQLTSPASATTGGAAAAAHPHHSDDDAAAFGSVNVPAGVPLRQAADLEAAPDLDMAPLDAYTGLYERPVLRPIPRLFGAGEVTGGLHGANRLAGNSLLECVVFGRIAGERAAATALASSPALRPDVFTPLTFRESHKVAEQIYLYRFNLPSPLHGTGLAAGQYISVRAVVDGKEVVRFYSPVSRPEAPGHLDLLVKVDTKGGAMSNYLNALVPGGTLDFRGPLGGIDLDLRPGRDLGRVKRIGLIAGGTGIAPMLQILRTAWVYNTDIPIKLLYSAAVPEQLAYLRWLKRKSRMHSSFTMKCAVDTVPPGVTWNEAVGFVTEEMLRSFMWPPAPDVLIVMCGPFPMCKSLKAIMTKMGYTIGNGPTDQVYSYM